jgi:hypothetical protein
MAYLIFIHGNVPRATSALAEGSEAIATVYRLREEQETAKTRRAANVGELRVALLQAREAQRNAERALREHI